MTLIEKAPFDLPSFSRPLTTDRPAFCPLCGRALYYMWWDTVDGDSRYNAFACFGSHGRLWQHIAMRLRSTWPAGLHYRYEFGPTPVPTPPMRFDSRTGDPLDHGPVASS